MRHLPAAATLWLAALVLVAACGPGAASPSPSAPAPSTPPASGGGPGNGAGPRPPNADDLVGRTFIVQAADGYTIVPGSAIVLTFDNGQLGIRAGCNVMGGAWQVGADGALTVGMMSMTEMACEEPLMAQDTFISVFVDGTTLIIDGDTLTLAKDGVTLTALDEAVANPDLPIEGTTWTVDGLITGQAVSSMPAGVVASFVISNGAISLNAGCNTGKGSVSIVDNALEFGPIGLTKMGCKGDAMAVEQHLVGVLSGDVRFEIKGDSLTLAGANGGLTAKGS
jgi:heat shock protein HslJ